MADANARRAAIQKASQQVRSGNPFLRPATPAPPRQPTSAPARPAGPSGDKRR
jgi:hypothetical protein